jgi:hypothetical protein
VYLNGLLYIRCTRYVVCELPAGWRFDDVAIRVGF